MTSSEEKRRNPGKPRAVLLFAGSLPLDLVRRRWPKSFHRLLSIPFVDSGFDFEADLHLFTPPSSALPSVENDVTIHFQTEDSFGKNLQTAVDKLAELGYQEIVIVGRDCPELDQWDIHQAFQQLQNHRLVLGPDHRGGVYLIALHSGDRSLIRKVQWQKNTDCAQLQKRFGRDQTYLLPTKLDLDTLADLSLLARSRSVWRHVAQDLLQSVQRLFAPGPPLCRDAGPEIERIDWQLPPPLLIFHRS
ncbi:DUF2064 domain-containing protein [Acidobacteria bacterium AH-259-D05]|nr:DUF2064 domain-containing protein [Acidobacteria bacterium AH-259-D05]